MSNKKSLAQAKYDSTHCTIVGMKLNNKTDKDILDKLNSVSSKQGYIRQLIKLDIENNATADCCLVNEEDKAKVEHSGDERKQITDCAVEDKKRIEINEAATELVDYSNVSDRKVFRRNLSELMRTMKIKQVDLANSIDVSYQTVSAWITGRGYPRTEAMERLCRFLGVKQSVLIEPQKNKMSQEDALLATFRSLSNQGKEKLIERAKELTRLHPKGEDIGV